MVVVRADVTSRPHVVAVMRSAARVGQLVKATSEGHAKAWVSATRELGHGRGDGVAGISPAESAIC